VNTLHTERQEKCMQNLSWSTSETKKILQNLSIDGILKMESEGVGWR